MELENYHELKWKNRLNDLDRKFKILLIFITLVISIFPFPACLGKDKMKGPPKPPAKNQRQIYGSGDIFLLNVYQKWISPVKGGNTCPMYPACSQYAKISFQVYPWYEAYFNIPERLLRCGNELHLYPIIKINGQRYRYDPIIIQDFIHEAKITRDDQ